MLLTLSIIILVLAQAQPADADLMLKIFVPTGGVSGILYLIWYYTFKQNKKDFTAALENFKYALEQNQKQFDKALLQIEKQHLQNLEQTQKTIDRMFAMMDKDIEYKEVLTGVLTEMKRSLIDIQSFITKKN